MHPNLKIMYSNSGSKSLISSLIHTYDHEITDLKDEPNLQNNNEVEVEDKAEVEQSPNLNKSKSDEQFDKELKKYEDIKISML